MQGDPEKTNVYLHILNIYLMMTLDVGFLLVTLYKLI